MCERVGLARTKEPRVGPLVSLVTNSDCDCDELKNILNSSTSYPNFYLESPPFLKKTILFRLYTEPVAH